MLSARPAPRTSRCTCRAMPDRNIAACPAALSDPGQSLLLRDKVLLALVQRGTLNTDKMKARTPLPRLGRPQDIAAMAAFLGSPGAAWINGAVIPVDGGWTAQ